MNKKLHEIRVVPYNTHLIFLAHDIIKSVVGKNEEEHKFNLEIYYVEQLKVIVEY